MQIFLAKTMGFCNGVKRAVNMAFESGSGSYTLGPLIHNPQMVERLKEKGITKTDSIYGLPEGSKVIFRSHGESPTSYTIAQSRSLEIVDATCPNVKKVQDAAKDLTAEGYHVVVIGDPKHPEVASIKAWGGNGTVVVENEEAVANLPEGSKYGIIAQTTCIDEVFERLSKLIEAKASEVKTIRTICSATKDRQEATTQLAQKSDTVIVVGGRNSANTRHLKEVAEKYCSNVILIETAAELSEDMFASSKVVGITAGASTPDWVIEEVVKRMENMGDIFTGDGLRKISNGDIIEGTVVSVNKDELFVDISYKSEGIISRSEFSYPTVEDLSGAISPGEKINVLVLNTDKEGTVILSKTKADAITAIDKLEQAHDANEVVEVTVTGTVKGGVTCNVFGVSGFIPASHVDITRIEDLTCFVGQKLPAQIIELDLQSPKKRIVLSRRDLLRKEKERKEKELYENIKVGGKYPGVVSRITNFGAFVDIGGVEGLLHVSEISWQKVKHPSDVLQLNDKVQVLCQKVDVENKKISLNLRDLQQDSWLVNIEKLKEGQIVEGKVSKLAKFGAFVALDDVMEGLVHISEISEERVDNPENVLQIGQTVKAKILKIDKKTKKLSLSIAEAKAQEEKEEFKEYLGNNAEFGTSIGSKFDLSKLFKE